MERFVQFVVAGGVALVAGLWLQTLFGFGSMPGLAGVTLAVVGAGALVVGIGREIEYPG